MHSSFTVHHPPADVAPHTPTSNTLPVTVPTFTVVSRISPSYTTPAFSTTTAVSSSLSSASRLDQALLFAGVLTFTSASAYAAYSYWQRASSTAANGSRGASVKPTASTKKSQQTEYAAATAEEQLTKPLDAAKQANTTPAATISKLPAKLRTRLSAARGLLFDLDGTLVESAEIWYEEDTYKHAHKLMMHVSGSINIYVLLCSCVPGTV